MWLVFGGTLHWSGFEVCEGSRWSQEICSTLTCASLDYNQEVHSENIVKKCIGNLEKKKKSNSKLVHDELSLNASVNVRKRESLKVPLCEGVIL